MANEVLIEEYGEFKIKYMDGTPVPVVGEFLGSQVLTVGTLSAAFDPAVKLLRIVDVGGAGFWFKMGDSSVSAAAFVADNRYVHPSTFYFTPVLRGETYIDTAV